MWPDGFSDGVDGGLAGMNGVPCLMDGLLCGLA